MGFFHRLRERFGFIPALLCLGAFVLAETLSAVNGALLRNAFVSAGHHPHDVRELARHADDVLAELDTADRTHPSEGHPA